MAFGGNEAKLLNHCQHSQLTRPSAVLIADNWWNLRNPPTSKPVQCRIQILPKSMLQFSLSPSSSPWLTLTHSYKVLLSFSLPCLLPGSQMTSEWWNVSVGVESEKRLCEKAVLPGLWLAHRLAVFFLFVQSLWMCVFRCWFVICLNCNKNELHGFSKTVAYS